MVIWLESDVIPSFSYPLNNPAVECAFQCLMICLRAYTEDFTLNSEKDAGLLLAEEMLPGSR